MICSPSKLINTSIVLQAYSEQHSDPLSLQKTKKPKKISSTVKPLCSEIKGIVQMLWGYNLPSEKQRDEAAGSTESREIVSAIKCLLTTKQKNNQKTHSFEV